MLKKFCVLCLVSALFLPATAALTAAQQVFLDLENVKGATAMTMNGVIMAPVRPIAEKAGCTVKWSAQKRQLEVTRPHEDIAAMILEVGNKTAFFSKYAPEIKEFVGGEEPLPAAPVLRGGTLYAPVDFIATSLGHSIDYNVDSSDIYIFSPEYTKSHQGEGRGAEQPKPAAKPASAALTIQQKKQILSVKTRAWTKMDEAAQNKLLEQIRRWWKADLNFTPQDDFADKVGRQMGQYYRTATEIGVFETACELEGLDPQAFMESIR